MQQHASVDVLHSVLTTPEITDLFRGVYDPLIYAVYPLYAIKIAFALIMSELFLHSLRLLQTDETVEAVVMAVLMTCGIFAIAQIRSSEFCHRLFYLDFLFNNS